MRTISRVSKAIVATGVTVGMLLAAAPAAAALNCTVKMVGTTNTANQTHSRWTVDANGVASGMIVVSGDASCQQAVTLSAWQAPNADKGQPYDQQKQAIMARMNAAMKVLMDLQAQFIALLP